MRIETPVLEVLSRAQVTAQRLTLPSQLDRPMYLKVNQVIEAAGGKWNRKAKAHLFEEPAEEVIERIILAGEVTTTKELGYFPTPPAVIDMLLDRAGVKEGHAVLEPSAGRGAIAFELLDITETVDCVELDKRNFEALERSKKFRNLFNADFLTLPKGQTYDRVVMNPPFAKQADIDHVLHALTFLRPGGILVSVMSAGILFRKNGKTTDFLSIVGGRGGTIEPLPDESFKVSGTMVRTAVVTIPGE